MSAPFILSLLLVALCLLHTGLAQECECPVCHDDGYEAFPAVNGSRYKVSSNSLQWEEAKLQCQSDGGGSSLVVINSDTEAAVIRTLIARLFASTKHSHVWVGINDLEIEGVWRTVHGCLVSESGYNIWAGIDPSGGTAENCGLVYIDARFQDYPCTHWFPFICEKHNV